MMRVFILHIYYGVHPLFEPFVVASSLEIRVCISVLSNRFPCHAVVNGTVVNVIYERKLRSVKVHYKQIIPALFEICEKNICSYSLILIALNVIRLYTVTVTSLIKMLKFVS